MNALQGLETSLARYFELHEGSGFDNAYLESSGLQLVLNCLTSLRRRRLLWLRTVVRLLSSYVRPSQ